MLTVGAIKCVACTDPYISNSRATARAGFTRFFKDIAAMYGLALDTKQITLCATKGNSLSQNIFDRGMKLCEFLGGKGGRRTTGIDPGKPQAFICIPIPQPCKDALIQ